MEEQPNKLFPVKPRLPSSRKPQSCPESRFWKSFKNKNQPSPSPLPITSISFSPEPPHHFAITTSTSLSLYSAHSFSPKTTLSSFKDLAYSASFRPDGKLLAASDQSGLIHVVDPKTRFDLRPFRAHSRAVHVVQFPLQDNLHLLSCGDDALVKFWDISSETELLSLQSHKDYVRSASPNPASYDLWATGSYDHSVLVWDLRTSKTMMGFNHGYPVEDVLYLPSGGLIATAGGNVVKIWDVIGGGRLVHSIESHNKTVTSMCIGRFSMDEHFSDRLLSVSLDGYLKVFDYASCKITHSVRYPSPLMSIGFSPSGNGRVIGTTNGSLFIARRLKDVKGSEDLERIDGSVEETEKQVSKPRRIRYFQRGQGEKPSEGDYLVKRPKKVKLAEHDKHLKRFRHKEALVSALRDGKAHDVVSVMEELVSRKKLMKCIANLEMDELELLLGFLQKLTTVPRYAGFLMGLTSKVLQLRAKDIRALEKLKGHVANLKAIVAQEVKIQYSLQEIQGIISPLLRIAGR